MNHMDHTTNMNHRADNATDACPDHSAHTIAYFHTGYCAQVLFKELRTTSAAEMVAACVAIFFVAVLYEGIKACREFLLANLTSSPEKSTKKYSTDTRVVVPRRRRILSCTHFVQTLLHAVQVFLSYCLMMVFMTFNAWLCIAVVVGAAVGFFLFGWMRNSTQDANEHCH